MRQVRTIYFVFFLCITAYVNAQNVYSTERLKIEKISENTYMHISYLKTEDFGNVACNGMLVVNDNEVVIYDTPTDNDSSLELIHWIETDLKVKIRVVIPTHFHSDCLGGLGAFHEKGIPSLANKLTIELAKQQQSVLPEKGFNAYYEHTIGNEVVISDFLGTGHTRDNIIGYFPKDKVLFGGCLIKSLDAGKGYLGDATPDKWSETVTKLKNKYPDARIIIPGHGKPGGVELLDYTIDKFSKKVIEK